ncbi:MAG: YkgJ family cysteine cluster protein [Desulfosalsimonadaceae bacterium]|nr:YkgJ family cysteine cluster protein [Desulfosalsimonadaceae bacterium]
MKLVETDNLSDVRGRMIKDTDTFAFRCHPGVSCFNKCCRNLNFYLNPYDIIRLKQNLNIPSDAFIENYTDIVLRPGHYFPDVLLRMADNPEKTCPFLTDTGCRVYADRPHTCRAFPVEHGLYVDAEKNATQLVHFFRPPEFCEGRHENTVWTLKTWEADQEAAFYNQMTAAWANVMRLFQADPFGGQGPEGQKGRMAFMAAYNVDAFRKFVLNSTFLQRYKIQAGLRMRVKTDDVAVFKLGMAWIKMFLLGIKTSEIKPKG